MSQSFLTFLFSILLLPVLAADPGKSLTVKKVVDGDTLHLSDGRKIRLIGVDTPELHPSAKLDRDAKRSHQDKNVIQKLGGRASHFTKKLMQGERVELEFDPVNAKHNNKDKYGRTLAYVWFDCDKPPDEYLKYLQKAGETWKPQKLMLNRLLVQCGYGNAYTRFPFKHMEEFRKYERQARELELGLYAPIDGLPQINKPATPKKSSSEIGAPFIASINGKVYHSTSCPHIQDIKPANRLTFESEEEALTSGRHKCRG